MTFGIFIHRSDSIYDDSPAERYQFPRQYLQRAQACVGSWIIYYEPKKVLATRGYFAVAKVREIIDDPETPGMFIAVIEPGSYLDFASPVPFNNGNGVIESGLMNPEGVISGRAQSAIRPLSPADFSRIVEIGLANDYPMLPRIDTPGINPGLREETLHFEYEDTTRYRTEYLGSRILRDRVFRKLILRAYDSRCAITGLKLINGGGRAEVEAAHIKPVEASGPDVVNNGLALSGTAHWMFDRGLIGVSDDLEILISRRVNDIESVRSIINKDNRLFPPIRALDRPHPRFLRWHRENCFKE